MGMSNLAFRAFLGHFAGSLPVVKTVSSFGGPHYYDTPAEWYYSGLMAAWAATLKDLGSLSDQDFASKRTGHITLYRGSGSDWAGKSA